MAPYKPIQLSKFLWKLLSERMELDKQKSLYSVISAVQKIDPNIIRFSYKGETHFTVQSMGMAPYPTPLPESCHGLMDTYLAKRAKLDEDEKLFISCFGSMVPHLKSKQDLRNILPDTFINKTSTLGDMERTIPLGDMAFQNMTPFNQYRELIIPMIDWYLGMELII